MDSEQQISGNFKAMEDQQNLQAVVDAQNTIVNRLKDQLKRLQSSKSSLCGGCGEQVVEQIQKELSQECHKLTRMVDYIVRHNKVMHVTRTLDLARELSEDNVGGTPKSDKASEEASVSPSEAAAMDNYVKDRLIDCLQTRICELEGKISGRTNMDQTIPLEEESVKKIMNQTIPLEEESVEKTVDKNNPFEEETSNEKTSFYEIESETESEVSGKIEEVYDPLELQKIAANALLSVDQKEIVEEIKESLKTAEEKLAGKQQLPENLRELNVSYVQDFNLTQDQEYNEDLCLPQCKNLREQIKNIANERDTLKFALSEHEYSIKILKEQNELLEKLFQESKLQIENLQDEIRLLKESK